ncbi:MAG: LacI family DNA-binding transcriptional regulator [Planctomycetota bacterium]
MSQTVNNLGNVAEHRLKRVRITDIAQAANVSRATVSKVLLGTGGANTRVSASTAERVRRLAQKLDFRPNLAAQTLAGKRTRVIGAVIDVAAGASANRRLQTIDRVCTARGYRLLVGYVHNSYDKIAEFADDFYGREVEGVICMAHNYPEFGLRITQLFRRFPNRVFTPAPMVDAGDTFVSTDFRRLSYLAADHLLKLGRRRVVMVRRYGDASQFRVRDWDGGFRDAHQAHGRELEPRQIVMGETSLNNRPRFARDIADKVLAAGADAVVTTNDTAALWLMGELRRRGHRIPEDVAIVGCQRDPDGWASDIRLTSVDRRERIIARHAINQLLEQIDLPPDQPRTPRRITVAPRLVVGDSCGARRSAD